MSHEHLFSNFKLANDKKYLQDLVGRLEGRLNSQHKSDVLYYLGHQLQLLLLRLKQLQRRRDLRESQHRAGRQPIPGLQEQEKLQEKVEKKELEDKKNEKTQQDLDKEKTRKKSVNIGSPYATYNSSVNLEKELKKDEAELESKIEHDYRRLKRRIFSEKLVLQGLLQQTQPEQQRMREYIVKEDQRLQQLDQEFKQVEWKLENIESISRKALPDAYRSQESSYRAFLQEFRINKVKKVGLILLFVTCPRYFSGFTLN